ncbi:UNVERIFIED_CONTAM: hypothetical protein HHA_203620 [Hammondia hammondi]|eukprot:XP_008884643.1 hypothetical protein HHA_203620 [Hammondia hammondi]
MGPLRRLSSGPLAGFRRHRSCGLIGSTGRLCPNLRQSQSASHSVSSLTPLCLQQRAVCRPVMNADAPCDVISRFVSPDSRPLSFCPRDISGASRGPSDVPAKSQAPTGVSINSALSRERVRSRSTQLDSARLCLVSLSAAPSLCSTPRFSSCHTRGGSVKDTANASSCVSRRSRSESVLSPQDALHDNLFWLPARRRIRRHDAGATRVTLALVPWLSSCFSLAGPHARFYSSSPSERMLCSPTPSQLASPPSPPSPPPLRVSASFFLRASTSPLAISALRTSHSSHFSAPGPSASPLTLFAHASFSLSAFPLLGQARDAAVDAFVPGGGCSWIQVRWKKKRGKKEKVILNAEQVATKTRLPPIRLEDRITPEPPATVARNIRSQISRAVAGWKTKRMFTYRNKYRLRRLVGMTHDVDSDDEFAQASARTRETKASTSKGSSSGYSTEKAEGVNDSTMGRKNRPSFAGRTFVTPLTKLQHQAALPRSPLHARFDFPHTVHYDVFWGPPQVEEEPNKTGCWVSFRVADLKLSDSQAQRLLDILGPERYDEQTGVACLEADVFPQLNHNAAYLGDILQQLMREVKKA